MTLAELADVAEVERLALRPGDVLVLKFPRRLSDEDMDWVREQVDIIFPDQHVKSMICDDGMDLAVLRAENVSMTLGWDDCDPVAVCSCGARCKGDSVNDALIAWGQHRASTHRNEGEQS